MCERLSFRRGSIMAGRTSAIYLGMIDLLHGFKGASVMTGLAGIAARDVCRGFSLCPGAVVTTITISSNLAVIHRVRYFPTGRRMANAAIATGLNMADGFA